MVLTKVCKVDAILVRIAETFAKVEIEVAITDSN